MIASEERNARKMEYARKAWVDFRAEAALVPLDATTEPEKAWMANDCEALFLMMSAVLAFPLNDALDRGQPPPTEFVLNLVFQAGQGLGALMDSQEPALGRAMMRALSEGVRQGAEAHAEALKPVGSA